MQAASRGGPRGRPGWLSRAGQVAPGLLTAWPTWLVLSGVTLAALALRLPPFLAGYPLHRDEALYGYWARLIASGQDPLLLIPWIDKPPLTHYLMAGSFRLFGVSDWALRLPGMVASALTVPALFGLARRAYGSRVAWVAATLLALSPFAILFAPTAFTDPWLTLWLVLGAWAALARRPFLAGLLTALAVATKQQGVFVVLLVLALLAANEGRGKKGGIRLAAFTSYISPFGAALLGFALIFGPLTYWDSLRWHNRPSFWDQSLSTYNPLTLVPLAEWPARLGQWAGQAGYWFGHPVVTAVIVGLAAIAVWYAIRNRGVGSPVSVSRQTGEPAEASQPQPMSDARTRELTILFAAYIAGFFAVHVFVTFQPWDRYLLPLVPPVCLLAAYGLVELLARVRGPHLPVALTAALAYAAVLGMGGRLPIGSDHGAYTGLPRAIEILHGQPSDAVVYHHALSWHFDYYLFDAPQERRWFGSGWQLADAAAHVTPGRPQWIVLPAFEQAWAEAVRLPLAARGLGLGMAERVYRPDGSLSFLLYRVIPLREVP